MNEQVKDYANLKPEDINSPIDDARARYALCLIGHKEYMRTLAYQRKANDKQTAALLEIIGLLKAQATTETNSSENKR